MAKYFFQSKYVYERKPVKMRENNPLMFSVVDDLDTAHTLVGATQNIVGDLEQPNSVLIFITPLVEVYGLNKENRR